MLRWLTERRRRQLLAAPFPQAWDELIEREVRYAARLDPERRARLRELTQVFVAEKRWEGCGGLELTDEHRVVIAAQAVTLILGRDHELFADVESILVYPSTVRPPTPRAARHALGVVEPSPALLGQAFRHGPVILAWDDVLAGAHEERVGHNVVFHELAHKIDMVDGEIDGTPPLPDRAHRVSWAEACSAAYLALREAAEHGTPAVLDRYGASNEAEFFAVATEAYFTRPRHLAAALPDLYAVFADFYATPGVGLG